jgi:Raf kinase inhibitor-like YbhB/YbcL family protein
MKHSTISPASEVHYRQLEITSPAFLSDDYIPSKYTCDGLNVSPPLDIDKIPKDARSFVLIVEDPDASGGNFVHWLVWNIPVKRHLAENEIHGIEGLNDFDEHHYGGPCPPGGRHRYFFKIYALDSLLELPPETNKEQLEQAMREYIIAYGELVGVYQRQ